MFGIQFDATGVYLVGTQTEQLHVSFDEMISCTGGIIGLLEYGITWKVLKGILGRIRNHLSRHADTRPETEPTVWIDNSGPVLYEIRHGVESIRVSPQDLESSRFGKAMKEYWDGGMVEAGVGWNTQMMFEALFVGLWRSFLRSMKPRKH
ncbi:hypothetical protein N7528_003067 [Penicillium herquei]|nr:hypothetical protein N7528_003067 [Penicillium herquei]